MGRKPISKDRLKAINDLVNAGAIVEAQRALAALPRGVRSEDPAMLANLHRRAGDARAGLRLLARVVHPEDFGGGRQGTSTPFERMVFGACLLDVGALSEAASVLSEKAVLRIARAGFFLAITHIRRWNWVAALPLLDEFLAGKPSQPGDRLGGMFWRAECLLNIEPDLNVSRAALEELYEHAASQHAEIAQRSLLLLAQNRLEARDPRGGRTYLNELDKAMRVVGDYRYAIGARLWRALFDVVESRGAKGLDAFEKAKREAIDAALPDRVRAADLHRGLIMKDEELLHRVWFGSPIPLVRARVEKAVGGIEAIPKQLLVALDFEAGPRSAQATRKKDPAVVSIWNGSSDVSDLVLTEGQVPQRLFHALAKDLYRPASLALLHEEVHPGEHFNAFSSPERMHQALWRLRDWFKKAGLPMDIQERDGLYRLVASGGPCSLRLTREIHEPLVAAWVSRELQVAREAFGAREFSAMEAAGALGVSRPTAYRWLQAAVAAGEIVESQQGRAARYRFTP